MSDNPQKIDHKRLFESVGNNDIVQFVYMAEDSKAGQPTQSVRLKTVEISDEHIRGINVDRILDGTAKQIDEAWRTYRIDRIVADTFWKKIA